MEKMIDSGISAEHAKGWTIPQAMREVLQNYIDAMYEYRCQGEATYEDGYAVAHDYGPGLSMKHFAFGLSEKRQGSIGQFGEGLKSAFVTLARAGRIIEIRFGNVIASPLIRPSETFGVPTLHYQFKETNENIIGTRVSVECYPKELDEAKTYFAYFGKDYGLVWLEEERISLPAGYIYVNNSRIADVKDSLYSYHLEGEDAQDAINRDRSAVDMNIITPLIAETIETTDSLQVMRGVLSDIITQANHFEAGLRIVVHNEEQKKKWFNVFETVAPPKSVVSHSWEVDNHAKYIGYNILNLDWSKNKFLSSFGVADALSVVRQAGTQKRRFALDELTDEERHNFELALRIVDKYYFTPTDVYVGELENEDAHGLYEVATQEIVVARKILTNLSDTVEAVFHEMVHKQTGEKDVTHGFQSALDRCILRIMKWVENGTIRRDSEHNLFEEEWKYLHRNDEK